MIIQGTLKMSMVYRVLSIFYCSKPAIMEKIKITIYKNKIVTMSKKKKKKYGIRGLSQGGSQPLQHLLKVEI